MKKLLTFFCLLLVSACASLDSSSAESYSELSSPRPVMQALAVTTVTPVGTPTANQVQTALAVIALDGATSTAASAATGSICRLLTEVARREVWVIESAAARAASFARSAARPRAAIAAPPSMTSPAMAINPTAITAMYSAREPSSSLTPCAAGRFTGRFMAHCRGRGGPPRVRWPARSTPSPRRGRSG